MKFFICLSTVVISTSAFASTYDQYFNEFERPVQESEQANAAIVANQMHAERWAKVSAYIVRKLKLPEGTAVQEQAEGEDAVSYYKQYDVGNGSWGCKRAFYGLRGFASTDFVCISSSGARAQFSSKPVEKYF